MEYRQLGRSGLKVSALTLGTMTFGGKGNFAKTGNTDIAGARRQIDMCLDAGINLYDTADVYSTGASEEILGEAVAGKRDRLLIATKARFPMGEDPNDLGLSRHHLVRACEASLKRLKTDYIDLYQLHEWDGLTPLEETLAALDDLVRAGKVRYVGVSNFSGWHLMKALGISECDRLVRPVHSRSTTRFRRARPNTSWSRSRSIRASAFSSGPAGGRAALRQIPPWAAGARGHPQSQRLARAAGT